MTNSNPVGKVRMLLRVLFAFLVRFQACGSNLENEQLQSDCVFCGKLQLAQIYPTILFHTLLRVYIPLITIRRICPLRASRLVSSIFQAPPTA